MGLTTSSDYNKILLDINDYTQLYNTNSDTNIIVFNNNTQLINYKWFENLYSLDKDYEKLKYFVIDFKTNNISKYLLFMLESLLISGSINNNNLKNITDSFFKKMLNKNINLISCLKHPTEEQYIFTIQSNTYNDKVASNIPNEDYTQNIIIELIRKDYRNIEFIPKEKMNEELYKMAIIENVIALSIICDEHKTKEICLYAFSKDSSAINYISKNNRDETIGIIKEIIKNTRENDIAEMICSEILEKKHISYNNNFYHNEI